MLGTRFGFAIGTVLITLAGVSAASAADYTPPPPPPVVQPQPCCNDWYLRGFVGVGINNKFDVEYLPSPGNVGNGFAFDHNSNSDTYFIGGGIGYNWNSWLRFDATAEYRGRTQVNARGIYNTVTYAGDSYQGYIKSWVFLANAYIDLGTWDCFTPYVGAGVGGAYNELADFVDTGIGTTGHGFGRNSGNWSLAWALHAGVSYEVSKSLKIDLAYRYLDFGSVTDTVDCVGGAGTCGAGGPDSYKFSNLHSNDVMLSLRWSCCELATQAPRYYTPPPAYEPPPAYQPPLHSKG